LKSTHPSDAANRFSAGGEHSEILKHIPLLDRNTGRLLKIAHFIGTARRIDELPFTYWAKVLGETARPMQ
jgi:hypothetical protein